MLYIMSSGNEGGSVYTSLLGPSLAHIPPALSHYLFSLVHDTGANLHHGVSNSHQCNELAPG